MVTCVFTLFYPVGTGKNNTQNIVSACATAGIAARLCNDLVLNGYDDWYLPSLFDIGVFCNIPVLNPIFENKYYHSSSQRNSNTSWSKNLVTGSSNYDSKNTNYAVRAVRSF